ncbi:MAG: glycosidase [Chitinophagaceae bacterium]|nr:MAG: glycosidase [Chitinophagaceae bacterium]
MKINYVKRGNYVCKPGRVSLRYAFLLLIAFSSFCPVLFAQSTKQADWELGPFVKVDKVNPIMGALETTTFLSPISNKLIKWEEKDVFNPTALVKDGKAYLLYRAEDKVGKLAGTSRIGLAYSTDGLHFTRESKPVFYPDNDAFKKYEWEGGTEDPRVVQDAAGTYYMTYSAWEGTNSYMSIASSKDLRKWTKHGPVFAKAAGGKYLKVWAKSGAIVSKLVGSKMVAQKINGKYWMYWGDTHIFLATSADLVNWTPVAYQPGEKRNEKVQSIYLDIKPVFGPRDGKFDSDLVEPGPAPMITDKGILLIYNSRNSENKAKSDSSLAPATYSAGQILLDKNDPSKVLERCENYFITPDKDFEINGQVNRVCFVEGLIYYKNNWFLYYGTADSKIAVAVFNPTL